MARSYEEILSIALDTARVIAAGQSTSGGWNQEALLGTFDPATDDPFQYQVNVDDQRSRGNDFSTLDDDNTQQNIRFLAAVSAAIGPDHPDAVWVNEALDFATTSLLERQASHGGFRQSWFEGDPFSPESLDPVDDYRNNYDLNDRAAQSIAETLAFLHQATGEQKYLDALEDFAGFLLTVQGQTSANGVIEAAWSQSYDYEDLDLGTVTVDPARSFEPAAYSALATNSASQALLTISVELNDTSYLTAVDAAIAWLNAVEVTSGEWARFYEIGTGTAIYPFRLDIGQGAVAQVTLDAALNVSVQITDQATRHYFTKDLQTWLDLVPGDDIGYNIQDGYSNNVLFEKVNYIDANSMSLYEANYEWSASVLEVDGEDAATALANEYTAALTSDTINYETNNTSYDVFIDYFTQSYGSSFANDPFDPARPVLANALPDVSISADATQEIPTGSSAFFDADGDALTYTATQADGDPLPSWLTINASTGALTASPLTANMGTYSVVVTATEASGAVVSDRFDLTVGSSAGAPPVLVNTFPSDEDDNVPLDPVLTLTFDKFVTAGTGSIEIVDAGTGAVVETIDVTSSAVSFQNESATIETSVPLDNGTSYFVRVADGAIESTFGTAFPGISDAETLDFTTTVFRPADIAFVGYNSDNLTHSDTFGFVALTDLPAGTEIFFTEDGVDANGDFLGFERTVTWTSDGVTAGTVVTLSPVGTTGMTATSGTVAGRPLLLSDAGDQVLAYVGSPEAPTFIAALNMNGAFGAEPGDPSRGSALPPGLTEGSSALAITPEADNAYYSGPTNFADEASAAAALNNGANWTSSDSATFSPATDWAGFFAIGATLAPEIDVEGDGTAQSIADGTTTTSAAAGTDFGLVDADGTSTRSFVVHNDGTDSLELTQVVVTGDGAADFEVTGFDAGTLAPGETETFTVVFDASSDGVSNATVEITSNDDDEALYDFAISGTGDVTAPDLSNSTPVEGSVDIAVDTAITLTFNEDVTLGAGAFTLSTTDGSIVETFTVPSADGSVNHNGPIVTLTPQASLPHGTELNLTIDSGTVLDVAGNPYAGSGESGALTFTTVGGSPPMKTGVVIASGQSLMADWFQEGNGATGELDGVITTLTVQELSNLTGYELAQRINDGDTVLSDQGNGTVLIDGLLAADRFAIELFERESSTYDDIVVVRGASGGKAILDESTSSEDHFFDSEQSGASSAVGDGDGDFDGPLMTNFVKPEIDSTVAGLSNAELIGVIWAQGEADDPTLDANNEGTTADDDIEALYKTGLNYTLNEIINYTLNTYPSVFSAQSVTPTAYIQHIGGRNGQDNGIDDVKTIQEELAAENSNIVIATESYDLARQDSVHPTNESYQLLAERMAAFIADGDAGPRVTNVVLTSDDQANTATVRLILDFPSGFDGSDLDLGDDPGRYLAVFDETTDDGDGRDFEETPIPVTNVQIVGDTVVFTLGRAIDGDGTVLYGYTTSNFDGTNVVQPIFLENGDLDQPIYGFRQDFTEADYSGPDLIDPTLVSSVPSDDSISASATGSIVLTFSETVVAGTGDVELRRSDDDSLVGSSVSFNGNQVMIDPNSDLEIGDGYYVLVDSDAVEDVAGNQFAGITSTTALNFTVSDGGGVEDPGSIAFVAYSSDDTLIVDGFAFVALVDIPPGTEIKFTDNQWDGSALATAENIITWTSSGTSAGTVVTVERNGSTTDVSEGAITDGTRIQFSTGGDQIHAFTGSDTAPNFIASLNMSGGYVLESDVSRGTLLPAGLTEGTTALSIEPEVDNAYYSGPTTFNSAAEALGLINDQSNWTTSNNDIDPSNWQTAAYTVSPPTPEPEIDIEGTGGVTIADGDTTPSVADGTDFGAILETATADQTFTIQNEGNAVLTVSSITFSGLAASDFSVTSGFTSGTIPAGGSETFTVTFDPTAVGTRTATVNVNSDDADEAAYDFAVSGVAQGVGPEIDLSGLGATPIVDNDTTPDSADGTDFGLVGALGTAQNTFTITNSGNASLSVTSVSIGGAGAGDFAFLPGSFTGGSIAAGQSETFTIEYDPTADGLSTATVTVVSDDADETPYTFAIQGASDGMAPSLVSTAPADDALGVDIDEDIVLTFDEDVAAGAGTIVIRQASDDAVVETISITDPSVTVAGTTVTVDPTADLGLSTEYYVTVDTGAVTDLAGNPFSGISDPTALNFTTGALPPGPIFEEGFETDGEGTRYTSSNVFTDFDDDYFIRTDGSDIDTKNNDGYQGIEGSFFFAGEDLDGENPSDLETLTFNQISTSGFGDMTFTLSVGTGNTNGLGANAFDNVDYLSVLYSIDGGSTWQVGLLFRSADNAGDTANEPLALVETPVFIGSEAAAADELRDADGNGDANIRTVVSNFGTTDQILSNTLQDFSFEIPAAATVDIVIAAHADGGDEEFAFDNLRLESNGPVIPVPEIDVQGLNATSITDGDLTPDATDGTDFGAVGAGGTVERTFTIANTGTAPLNVTDVSIGGSTDFTIQPGSFTSGTIPAGQSRTFAVLFDPAATGVSDATITVTSDDADEAIYDFAITGVADVTVPALVSTSPSDDATEVAVSAPIVLTFDEAVQAGTGSIVIRQTSDDAVIETIPVTDPRVTISGSAVTVDPNATLAFTTGYYVTVDTGAITDLAGNPFAGITDPAAFNFMTGSQPVGPLFQESFETDGEGTRYTSSNVFTDLDDDYFIRTDGSDIDTKNNDGYQGADGQFFFAGEDLDGENPSDVETLTFGQVSTTGAGEMTFTGSFATGNTNALGANAFDNVDYVAVLYSVDGGTTWNVGLLFRAADNNGDTANEPLALVENPQFIGSEQAAADVLRDADGNGDANIRTVVSNFGSTNQILTNTFQDFSFTIPAADTVDLMIVSHADGGDEEFAFDNLRIESNGPVTPVPEIDVEGLGATSIADGDTTPDVADGTDFGAVGGTGTVERTFVIANDGTAVLNVSNVTVTGAGASDFTIQPGSFTSGAVQPGQTETVTILFDPAASGTSTATVSIFSDDADEATYDFAITGTADVTAPTLTASDPVDDATGISIGANIVLTFDEPVAAGSGNITLRTALGTVEAFDVNGPRVTVSGNTITLDPTALLDFETGYFVTVDATAVTDIAGNPFAGISNQTTLNFTTEIFVPDTVAPSLTGSTPADDATGVAVDSNIALTFDEPVQAGTGQIVIRLASDDSVVETITVPSGQVIVSGSTVTVNPSVTLAEGTEVYVTVSSGAIEDLAGNDFGGFSAPTDLNFTTVAGSTGGTSLPTPPVFDAGDPAYLPGATVGTSADDVLLGTAAGAKLDGKAGNDTIFSDGGNPTIRGRTGDDTIVGAGGNENIDADEDNDTVFGQGGNDKIKGGTGNDTIIGGLGDDVLDGEGGNDIIGFGEGADDVEGGGGADTFVYVGNGAGSEIEDFNTAEGDVLDLTNATTGSGPASNFVQLVDQGSTTLVRINADGQGTDFADAFTFGGDAANKDLTTLVNDGDLLV